MQQRASKPRASTPGANDSNDSNDTSGDDTASTPDPTPPNGDGTPGNPNDDPSPDAGASDASTADAAKPPSTATNGSGGPTGFNELTSTGGLKFQINAPAAVSTKPRGLLVLLHGSTASNYATFVNMMQAVAAQYDLIRVSVLAPNGQGWNEGQQPAAAELLHRLVQEDLYTKYNIDKSKIFFSGQSSGGGFLSSHFIPAHAKDYRGGAFLQCGATTPSVAFTPDAATKQGFRLHFEITTGDTIWPDSYKRSVAAYTAAGMQLTKNDTKPGGHCAFDQQQVIVDHIAAMLGGS
jgi:poly(3-hydroxybutyrate) depolymerase